MNMRDKARSDLYLAQLRTQSAPNTPGFAAGQTPRSARFPVMSKVDPHVMEEGVSPIQYAEVSPSGTNAAPSFKLQAPPIKIHHATPKMTQDGFESAPQQRPVSPPQPTVSPPPQERTNEHVEAAPGEQTYEAVPIPGAYAAPLTSPGFQPPSTYGHGQAY